MKKYVIILGFLGICVASPAQAAPLVARQPETIPYACTPTPKVKVSFPANDMIGKTNNLWRKTGEAVPAIGRPIYIRGVVLDKNCVPIQGAVVQLWQADAKGSYALENIDNTDNADVDPYFSASGTTYTNNLGEYSFITIFPGTLEGEMPYIRIRVKQSGFKSLETKMFFAGATNGKDEDYRKLSTKKRALLTATSDPNGITSDKNPTTYYFNLTLKGKTPYKEY